MKTEQGRDPAAAKAEYESLRSEIERLDARRKEVAEELRSCVDSGCAPDGVKLIPVTKIAITDPYALCEAIVEVDEDAAGYDRGILEAIMRTAMTLNPAKVGAVIEKAELDEAEQTKLAAFFSTTVSERLDVR